MINMNANSVLAAFAARPQDVEHIVLETKPEAAPAAPVDDTLHPWERDVVMAPHPFAHPCEAMFTHPSRSKS